MNYSEIMDLIHSGFSPEQIMTLTNSGAIPSAPVPEPVEEIPSPVPSESPIKEEGTGPVADPEPVPSSVGDPKPEADPLDEIRETVRQLKAENEDLKKQIQSANIRDRTIPSVIPPDASNTLAEIIRPTFNKGGK